MTEQYCIRCGRPHAAGECSRGPKTLAERLDAAETGEEFAQVLTGLFAALDRARHEEGN